MSNITGKIVLITGASSGNGLATARAAAELAAQWSRPLDDEW